MAFVPLCGLCAVYLSLCGDYIFYYLDTCYRQLSGNIYVMNKFVIVFVRTVNIISSRWFENVVCDHVMISEL